MAARFVTADSRRLDKAVSVITAVPFTVGMWLNPAGIHAGVAWTLSHTSTSTNYFRLYINSSQVRFSAAVITETNILSSASVVVDKWVFVICRGISTTNRRLSVLWHTGVIEHGFSVTSRSPSINCSVIGARRSAATYDNYFDGLIGEYWITNTDIQADGAQLKDSTLWQLAYQGPFSIPHIANDIVEYRSFRSRLQSSQDTPDEVYYRGTRPVWTNTNGVTLGPHPPAADNYVSPLTEDGPMVIV